MPASGRGVGRGVRRGRVDCSHCAWFFHFFRRIWRTGRGWINGCLRRMRGDMGL